MASTKQEGPSRLGRLHAIAEAIEAADGELSPALRRAVRAHASMVSGHELGAEAPALQGLLADFVDTVARHAYRVTDMDVERLHAAGYGDDAILEVVLSAATGAGLARLAIGLAALGQGE